MERKSFLNEIFQLAPALDLCSRWAVADTVQQAYQPALAAADSEVLDPIRADPERYGLSLFSDVEDAKLLAPTLIVCGRQDQVVGYRDSIRLLELYPRSTYAVLDRGGHDLPVDQTGLFEALVQDWLFRVNEWRSSNHDRTKFALSYMFDNLFHTDCSD